MAVIPPRDLAAAASVSDTDVLIVDKGSSVEKALPSQIVDAAIPLASQAEAEAGTDNSKRVTPLRVKQAIDAIGVSADSLAAGLATRVATADLASTDSGKGVDLVAGAGKIIPSRTAMKALTSAADKARPLYLTEGLRDGPFLWDSSDLSALVAADPEEGIVVAPDSDPTGASGAWVRSFTGDLDAGWFGLLLGVSGADAINAAITLAATVTASPVFSTYERVSYGVKLPAGNIVVASGDTIRLKKGVTLRGAGRTLTWITHGGGGVPCLDTDSALTDNTEIRIADLSIYGAGSTTTFGIDVNYSIRNCELSNVNVFGCNNNVRLTNCWTFRFDRCNLAFSIQDNLAWYNATAGIIRDCRLDSPGRTNILIDKSAFNTVNLNIEGSYIQFAQQYGINITSAANVSIFGGYFEGNNKADGGRSDILWQSLSDEGRVLNIFGGYFSTSNGSGATSRAIIARGQTLNMYGVREFPGDNGYTYSVEASNNCDVVNIMGCDLTSPKSIAATVTLNEQGDKNGTNLFGHLSARKKFDLGPATDLTIASGAITVTKSHHRVDTGGAPSPVDLVTINGGVDGQLLVLRTVDSARDVVIKHNTGNIKIGTGADFTLSTNIKSATLIYCADLGSGSWVLLSSV